jgi:hypothetical protein
VDRVAVEKVFLPAHQFCHASQPTALSVAIVRIRHPLSLSVGLYSSGPELGWLQNKEVSDDFVVTHS